MDSLLNFGATVIVAIIGLIGIIIQTKAKTKQESIESKIDALREETQKSDEKISKKLDESVMNNLKRFLITEMTKIKQGDYIPTDNQKRMLYEAKQEYNLAGGDSYVDDMFDECKLKKLI